MECEKHFLNLRWEHHTWRRRVLGTERMWASATDMWGRPVQNEHIRCRTEYVCAVCGAVKPEGFCHCDIQRGEGCAVRLAFLGATQPPPSAE